MIFLGVSRLFDICEFRDRFCDVCPLKQQQQQQQIGIATPILGHRNVDWIRRCAMAKDKRERKQNTNEQETESKRHNCPTKSDRAEIPEL